jgi:hypothetical protein
MFALRSMPVISAPVAARSASATPAVPVATSRTRSPGVAFTLSTTAARQRRSWPIDKR